MKAVLISAILFLAALALPQTRTGQVKVGLHLTSSQKKILAAKISKMEEMGAKNIFLRLRLVKSRAVLVSMYPRAGTIVQAMPFVIGLNGIARPATASDFRWRF